MSYKVRLENFEGPLDLLLFLIKKNEVEISDIPIAKITEQFLEYLEIIQMLDIESASEFILMAAMLMRIKAQLLLPRTLDEEDEEIEDPRQELVERLLEYKRFKESAYNLSTYELNERQYFKRGNFRFEVNGFDDELAASADIGLFDLVAAFKKILDQASNQPVHTVVELDVSLEERIQFLETYFEQRSKTHFSDIFESNTDKIVLIVTFIALLELIKRHFITISQTGPFEEIIIAKV